MERGRLRVFFGAAAGVGKTYSMLREGRRLADGGERVVVGAIETHGRAEIKEMALRFPHSGPDVSTLDVAAVLATRPDAVLVDELAQTNSPGARHPRRWQDVEELLQAGIDVFSTLNVQNLESLNDVVEEITGVRDPETIPDRVVRRLAEVELVDATQEQVRERMHAGSIYPVEAIDPTLANYFRPGSLAALRELSLSWLAERVDEDLVDYRSEHGIDKPWETRERILVGLSGMQGADVVIRRAARNALRSRASLLGVYVRPASGTTPEDDRSVSEQRALLESLGGEYHELAGDDVGLSLLTFARAENATQMVLGAPRRSGLWERLTGSPVMRVIRQSGTIDVHVISYEAERPFRRRRSSRSQAIGSRRRLLSWALVVASLPVLTIMLLTFRDRIALENVLLVYLLGAVGVGVTGGAVPAVVSAAGGFLLANWYFTPPFLTWKIDDAGHLFSLFAFLVVASAVGLLVGNATRRSAEAMKARAQAEALAATSTSSAPAFGVHASAVTKRIRDVFAMNAAAVLRNTVHGWETVAAVGAVELGTPEDASDVIPLTEDTVLALSGSSLTGDDRRVLRAFAAQMAQALDRERLEKEAAAVEAMTETDRLRTALLNAVSHDLRTPLATIKASVTSLLGSEVTWSEDQTAEFHGAILEETERLDRVVGRLLDASRVQVGAVHVFFVPVGIEEIVALAVDGLGVHASRVEVDIPESLPPVLTDPALSERVIANLMENALTWSPVDGVVSVSAGAVAGRVDLRIVDRGPGIPPEERDTVFQPFRRLGDSTRGSGVGLGMAVARGFLEAMGNELVIEDTPGGGTTMVIAFEPAPSAEFAPVVSRG